MLDRGESEVTGSAAVCAADLVYYAAEGERLVGLVKTRRLAYPPLAGGARPMGRCACDEVVRLAEAEGRAAKRIHRPKVAAEGRR